MLRNPSKTELDAIDLKSPNALGDNFFLFVLGDVAVKIVRPDLELTTEEQIEEVLISYSCQRLAAEHNLGPNVGEMIVTRKCYGFVTELINPVVSHDLTLNRREYEGENKTKKSNESIEALARFQCNCEMFLDYQPIDDCFRNMGYRKDPYDLMMLDWGNEEVLYNRIKNA